MRLVSLLPYLLSAVLLMLVFAWKAPNVGETPNWVFFLCAVPAILGRLWAIFRGDSPRSTPAVRVIGSVYLLVAAVFAMVIGGLGFAMKGSGSLLEVLWFMLPAGALLLVFTLVGLWLGARGR